MVTLFEEILQVALGNRMTLSKSPSKEEWRYMLEEAKRQTIVGLLFEPLNNLHEFGQKPSLDVLYEWVGLSEEIKRQNRILNKRCEELSADLEYNGFRYCILKGQGNAIMYPNPLLRQSGDIDVWVDGNKNDIINFVRAKYPNSHVASLHVEYPLFKDVDVELHFQPAKSITFTQSRKLRRYFESQQEAQFGNSTFLYESSKKINVPTPEFNLVYQLIHMQTHFFYGGIGLRQMIDYYFLLKRFFDIIDTKQLNTTLKELRLTKFANAIMWVLTHKFKMEEKYLLTPPDKQRGILLFNEMIRSGNFGKYDSRFPKKLAKVSSTLSVFARNMRMLKLFPEESMTTPLKGLSTMLTKKFN